MNYFFVFFVLQMFGKIVVLAPLWDYSMFYKFCEVIPFKRQSVLLGAVCINKDVNYISFLRNKYESVYPQVVLSEYIRSGKYFSRGRLLELPSTCDGYMYENIYKNFSVPVIKNFSDVFVVTSNIKSCQFGCHGRYGVFTLCFKNCTLRNFIKIKPLAIPYYNKYFHYYCNDMGKLFTLPVDVSDFSLNSYISLFNPNSTNSFIYISNVLIVLSDYSKQVALFSTNTALNKYVFVEEKEKGLFFDLIFVERVNNCALTWKIADENLCFEDVGEFGYFDSDDVFKHFRVDIITGNVNKFVRNINELGMVSFDVYGDKAYSTFSVDFENKLINSLSELRKIYSVIDGFRNESLKNSVNVNFTIFDNLLSEIKLIKVELKNLVRLADKRIMNSFLRNFSVEFKHYSNNIYNVMKSFKNKKQNDELFVNSINVTLDFNSTLTLIESGYHYFFYLLTGRSKFEHGYLNKTGKYFQDVFGVRLTRSILSWFTDALSSVIRPFWNVCLEIIDDILRLLVDFLFGAEKFMEMILKIFEGNLYKFVNIFYRFLKFFIRLIFYTIVLIDRNIKLFEIFVLFLIFSYFLRDRIISMTLSLVVIFVFGFDKGYESVLFVLYNNYPIKFSELLGSDRCYANDTHITCNVYDVEVVYTKNNFSQFITNLYLHFLYDFNSTINVFKNFSDEL